MKRYCVGILQGVVLGALLLNAGVALAKDYPSRPITLVVPYPAGGGGDTLGRLIAKGLGDQLGVSVIVENKAGAGTIIGAGYVAHAAPNGYTLLVSSGSTFTVNPAIHDKLPYDSSKSFEPVGIFGRTALILLANPKVPVNNLKELVAAVKATPDKYSFGTFGTGTTSHFAGELIMNACGITMQQVPYKGSSPEMSDLIGGQIPFSVDTVSAALPQIKAGKVKGIAVTSGKRSPFLPDVPTVGESGCAPTNMNTWIAMVAPKGLPADVKARLDTAAAKIFDDPGLRSKFLAVGTEPAYSSSAQLAELIKSESLQMKDLAKKAHIKVE